MGFSGSGCSGVTCGTLVVITTQSAGAATSATYTAPSVAPVPDSLTVVVTPLADPSKAAQRVFTIQGGSMGGGVSITVSPTTATRAINQRLTLTAQVSGTQNTNVTWNVNGVAEGSTAAGQICVVGSGPCQPVTGGSALQVDYVGPASTPSPNPVIVQVVSAAHTSKSAAAQITIINHVLVTVLPGSAVIAPLGVQAFAATVLGTDNQNVVWQFQGAGCSLAGVCGGITPDGFYSAPSAAPNPDALQAVAISSEDPSQSGSANVTISSGANIVTLHPASVYAGAADGFTLKVIGSGFASSAPGPASVLLIGGTARTTTRSTGGECIAPVTAADVALAGSVSVQIQNPDGGKSNAVPLVVAMPNISDDAIILTAGLPGVTAKASW